MYYFTSYFTLKKCNSLFPSRFSAELFLILFSKTVTDRKEIPGSLLIHVPHVCFLTSVLCVRLVNQVHKEEPVRTS